MPSAGSGQRASQGSPGFGTVGGGGEGGGLSG